MQDSTIRRESDRTAVDYKQGTRNSNVCRVPYLFQRGLILENDNWTKYHFGL